MCGEIESNLGRREKVVVSSIWSADSKAPQFVSCLLRPIETIIQGLRERKSERIEITRLGAYGMMKAECEITPHLFSVNRNNLHFCLQWTRVQRHKGTQLSAHRHNLLAFVQKKMQFMSVQHSLHIGMSTYTYVHVGSTYYRWTSLYPKGKK